MKQAFLSSRWPISLLQLCLFAGSLLLPASTLWSVSKKHVLVMEIKDIDHNPIYKYLEPTITDAVIKDLHQNFVFENFDKEDWTVLAKNNFILPESYHTKSAGMQLGLLGRQDVVIGGYFKVEGTKVTTFIHILGMKNKEVLREIKVQGYSDSRIWDTVKDIAGRVTKETKDLLPNDEEWTQTVIQGHNQFNIEAGIKPFLFPDVYNKALPSGGESLLPNDYGFNYHLGIDYSYYGLLWKDTIIFGNAQYIQSDQDFEAKGHDPDISKVGGSYVGYHFLTGVGYRFFSSGSYYTSARLGAGYFIGDLNLDFTTLNNIPSAAGSSRDLKKAQSTVRAVSTEFDVIIGYQLFVWLTSEFKISYQQLFFENDSSSSVGFTLGVGYKL